MNGVITYDARPAKLAVVWVVLAGVMVVMALASVVIVATGGAPILPLLVLGALSLSAWRTLWEMADIIVIDGGEVSAQSLKRTTTFALGDLERVAPRTGRGAGSAMLHRRGGAPVRVRAEDGWYEFVAAPAVAAPWVQIEPVRPLRAAFGLYLPIVSTVRPPPRPPPSTWTPPTGWPPPPPAPPPPSPPPPPATPR